MLSVTNVYYPTTQTYEQTVTLDLTQYGLPNQVFRTTWKLTPDKPYTAMMTSKKSLAEQFSDAYPGIPMDEWESLVYAIDDAHDITSMEEAWTAFLDIYFRYDLGEEADD